jgi:hypothetical protein
MTTEPTVHVSFSDYERLRNAPAKLDAKIQELQAQLEAAKLADPTNTIQTYRDAFCTAVKIVQFAVANLDPATVKGWPHEALRKLADMLPSLPGMTGLGLEDAPDYWRKFASKAAEYEEWRRLHRQPAIPASASDFGPQTDEAKLQHQARSRAIEDDAGQGPPATAATLPKAP